MFSLKFLSLVLGCALCLTGEMTIQASCWTYKTGFEVALKGSDGFSTIGSAVDRVSGASYSAARVFFRSGDTCWDPSLTCGAIYSTFPSPVGEGGELWCRAYYQFPSDWSWADQNPGVSPFRKILRFRVRMSDGRNRGYITVNALDDRHKGEVLINSEIGVPYSRFTRTHFYPNSSHWYCVEQYVKFSSNPREGIHRVWIDGVLVAEVLNHVTLGDSLDTCDSIYFFTYWNMKVARSQYAYIDDVEVTTDRPAGRDSRGNAMIGPIPARFATTPF